MNKAPIYIIGPPGCGKTTHAKQIAELFGCSVIIDDWTPSDTRIIPDNALVLTNIPVKVGGVVK